MATVIYLVRDLLFTSKIRETARQVGVEVAPVAQATPDARWVILDLRLADALDVFARLRASNPALQAIGFIDHENETRMAEAKTAGVALVMPKGKFSADLPKWLQQQANAQ
jgi:DNA-binding NarL/FixJ family response regulator